METLILYLVIPGRINFLQLGRYGKSCEQRFRQNFSKDFDWLEFNLSLSDKVLTGDRKAIAIDPSYISKSGKNTPHGLVTSGRVQPVRPKEDWKSWE